MSTASSFEPIQIHTVLAASQGMGVAMNEHQAGQLLHFLKLLQHWNATYNLTAVREPEAMFTQHLLDCLAIIPALQRELPSGRVLDVGSGGGLPGIVIATMLPALQVVCVDAVGKKAAFTRQVAGELHLTHLQSVHGRVEQLPQSPQSGFDLITSRAFASLADSCQLTTLHLRPGGVWMAMKGKQPDDEIAALPAEIEVFHVEQLQVPGLDAQRCLVWMRRRPEAPSS